MTFAAKPRSVFADDFADEVHEKIATNKDDRGKKQHSHEAQTHAHPSSQRDYINR